MQSKQVILLKTEYDAMEAELADLRTIVASRTVLTVLEEKLDWYYVRSSASGTRIKYILGTDSDEENIKVLADQIEYLNKKLEQEKLDRYVEKGRMSDEINRLKKQKWYQKLFGKKK
jgi:hypothetical protein